MYNRAVLMFKVHMGLAPRYVSDLINRTPVRYGSNVLPRTHIDLYKTSFAFSGPSVWNSLPPKMKTYKSVRGFRINLRKILMNKLYNADIARGVAMFIAISESVFCFYSPPPPIINVMI